MTKIVIIDYGMGNIRSIEKKVNKIGYEVITSHEIDVIKTANKLILPGVGHFRMGMTKLKELKLIDILNYKILQEKTPILGICLGMQLFTRFSEEGDSAGFGWVNAETIKFVLNNIRYKVPHMGWNSIEQKKESSLLRDLPLEAQYYFVHSYHVKCNNHEDILTTSLYCHEFVSSIQKDNIFGTQFHPEKSHLQGEKMLKNFLTY
jgi:imidazole glycerol-phosphate synthase subunit HisH